MRPPSFRRNSFYDEYPALQRACRIGRIAAYDGESYDSCAFSTLAFGETLCPVIDAMWAWGEQTREVDAQENWPGS